MSVTNLIDAAARVDLWTAAVPLPASMKGEKLGSPGVGPRIP